MMSVSDRTAIAPITTVMSASGTRSQRATPTSTQAPRNAITSPLFVVAM